MTKKFKIPMDDIQRKQYGNRVKKIAIFESLFHEVEQMAVVVKGKRETTTLPQRTIEEKREL